MHTAFHFPISLLLAIPFLGAFLNLILGKKLQKGTVSLIGCGTIAITALLATQAVMMLIFNDGHSLMDRLFSADWISSTGDYSIRVQHQKMIPFSLNVNIGFGFIIDKLSAILLLIVTWISLLIHIYSIGYMKEDPNYSRFFAYLNLFTGSMLILILGDSLPVTFVGWEGVGLCSYLLIGFWHQEEKNASAGKKAFILNRIGDFGFILGMCLLFSLVGTLHYQELTPGLLKAVLAKPLWLGWPAHYFIAIFLFIGCIGKSAQIPLYVWLPDAMAGPTPVSALIHAATMVTAGVYVIARTHVLFDMTPATARMLVAGIGAATALFAATIGLVQKDFKKVLAYSTVSQLGFMFVGVGTGAYAAAIFHLLTHAFFKAGLFLGAGSVMHAMNGEGDISKMGGLRKHLPITHATFFIYCLAIAGIFPFSGFFSKDAILLGAWESSFPILQTVSPTIKSLLHIYPTVLWSMLLIAAFCTAVYMWRLYFLVFTGKFRGTKEQESHLHESPTSMTIPLIILAIGSIVVGLLGIPQVFLPKNVHLAEILQHFLGFQHTSSTIHSSTSHISKEALEILLMGVAMVVSLIGITVAYLFYPRGFSKAADTLAKKFKPIHQLLFRNYYINELYHVLFVKPLAALARLFSKFIDGILIDKVLVESFANIATGLGRAIRYVQDGDIKRYIVAILFGGFGLLYLVLWNPIHSFELSQVINFSIAQPSVKKPEMVEIQSGHSSLQVKSGEKIFYLISWGDKNEDKLFGNPVHMKTTHSYKQPGVYQIVVKVCEQAFSPEENCKQSDRIFTYGLNSTTPPTKTPTQKPVNKESI